MDLISYQGISDGALMPPRPRIALTITLRDCELAPTATNGRELANQTGLTSH
jgi:hypothetical protein